MKKRIILSDVALGNIPPDTIIINGTVFNVFTREFIRGQSIWIKDGGIAYVGPEKNRSEGIGRLRSLTQTVWSFSQA